MFHYLIAGSTYHSSCSYSMPGKAVYFPQGAFNTLNQIVAQQRQGYKSPAQCASAFSGYENQINALQSSLNSINAQCSQALSAKSTAESRCTAIESELALKSAKIVLLTQQNTALVAAQATLQQQLDSEAMQQTASDIAELKQALKAECIATDLMQTKYAHLESEEKVLKAEVEAAKLRLEELEKQHSQEIERMCDKHQKEINNLID